jgi:hypothetical protein
VSEFEVDQEEEVRNYRYRVLTWIVIALIKMARTMDERCAILREKFEGHVRHQYLTGLTRLAVMV